MSEGIYPSPFDYEKQLLLAVPTDLPNPTSPHYTEAVMARLLEYVKTCKVGTFILFTSHAMLRRCHQALASAFEELGYQVLCQGDSNRNELIRRFRESRSVLFGSDSFWEGVDVQGTSLQSVIIVKLPFQVPTEPLTQARLERIEKRGGKPFWEYSLPHAIVKFKQGFGRLIRNGTDIGTIICLDPRLATKSYGKRFLSSLPSCGYLPADSSEVNRQLASFFKGKRAAIKKG